MINKERLVSLSMLDFEDTKNPFEYLKVHKGEPNQISISMSFVLYKSFIDYKEFFTTHFTKEME